MNYPQNHSSVLYLCINLCLEGMRVDCEYAQVFLAVCDSAIITQTLTLSVYALKNRYVLFAFNQL